MFSHPSDIKRVKRDLGQEKMLQSLNQELRQHISSHILKKGKKKPGVHAVKHLSHLN